MADAGIHTNALVASSRAESVTWWPFLASMTMPAPAAQICPATFHYNPTDAADATERHGIVRMRADCARTLSQIQTTQIYLT